ncbi:hypothetical protein V5O48_015136 [Marasmius crinis-equi]|uniref:Rhodopsin domain-containing protein n=1 Tax=Marasmius crinis-equi TaxID=585013 RepID=A0ABR3EVD0_9AGAR
MIGMIFFMTGIVLFTEDPHGTRSQGFKIAINYMIDSSFYAIIWPARASIFLTLIRLAFGRFRTVLKCCVGAVFVTWGILYGQVWYTCETKNEWKKQVIAQCMLGKQVAIAQLITDCLFDGLLIGAPAYLLRDMKNRRGLKIRLIAVFSSTVATTAFSLAHAWAIIEDRGALEFMLATFEVIVSLIVVNLTVIVSWLFNIKDDSTSMDSAQQVNTFLRDRLSSKRGGSFLKPFALNPEAPQSQSQNEAELDFVCTKVPSHEDEMQMQDKRIRISVKVDQFCEKDRVGLAELDSNRGGGGA